MKTLEGRAIDSKPGLRFFYDAVHASEKIPVGAARRGNLPVKLCCHSIWLGICDSSH